MAITFVNPALIYSCSANILKELKATGTANSIKLEVNVSKLKYEEYIITL